MHKDALWIENMALRQRIAELEQTVAQLAQAGKSDRKTEQEEPGERTDASDTERTLKQDDSQFRAFFEQAPIGIGVSRNGMTLMVNPSYCRMFGYDGAEELVGKPIASCIAPSEHAMVMERARRRLQGEPVETKFALTGMRRDGTLFPIICDVSTVQLADGLPASVAFFTDISELKQAEEALQQAHDELERRVVERTAELIESNQVLQDEIAERLQIEQALREHEQMLQTIFDVSPDIISICTMEGQIMWISPSASEIIGYSAKEELPQRWTDYIHPEDRQNAQGVLQGISAYTDHMDRLRYRVRHRDGHWVFLESRTRLITGDSGQPLNVVAISRDVTAQVELETHLKQARVEAEVAMRYKDAFLSSMSHELRTPLTAILGLSESLQEEIYGPLNQKQKATLATVEHRGRHLLSLINDILDLAKIETGKLSLQIDTVRIESICQTCLHIVEQQALKKQITLSLTLHDDVQTIQADEHRLKQMLINLLVNAVKFTAEGGKVGLEVGISPHHDQVQFTVWDTGIGIPQDLHQHLFIPFVQLDSGLSRHYEGTGLGLSLVKHLAAMHGGRVDVESTAGTGSRFLLFLPITSPFLS